MSNSHPFKQLKVDWIRLYRELPVKVSNLAMNEFKANFRRQGLRTDGQSVEKWKKRKKESGKAKGRPILTKSGRLKRSFKTRPTLGIARVINNAPYAKAHNEGFTGTQKVRAHTRRTFHHVQEGTGVYSVKTRKEKMRGAKKATGDKHKVKAHSRKMKLPARPFMVTTKALSTDIEKLIEKELKKIFK